MENQASFALGFSTQEREIQLDSLPVVGRMPEWLVGTLVRNGPAKFEVGSLKLEHWFDGLAMLHSFAFRNGQVSYANRFLRGKTFQEAESGKLTLAQFGTDPCRSIFKRLASLFWPKFTDNASVNVARVASRFIAMTETPLPVEFDPHTLATLGTVPFTDDLGGQLTTAHPHFDSGRGEGFNYVTRFGRSTSYNIFRLPREGWRRELLASIPVRHPAYMHSFALSENYIVLAEFPLVVSPWRLIFSSRPFIENYEWRPDQGTRLLIVERAGGKLRGVVEAEAFMAFHHINAFERDGELVLDVCAYKDAEVVLGLYLDHLKADEPRLHRPEFRRYRVPLKHGLIKSDSILAAPLELPRINYRRRNGRAYRHAYGVGIDETSRTGVATSLLKVDVETGDVLRYSEPDCYPGEPVFVESPHAKHEDDGVLLSVLLDTRRGASTLVVLDAKTLAELARAEVPQHIPFGFHGQFFNLP